jgi:hypothetical protein
MSTDGVFSYNAGVGKRTCIKGSNNEICDDQITINSIPKRYVSCLKEKWVQSGWGKYRVMQKIVYDFDWIEY